MGNNIIDGISPELERISKRLSDTRPLMAEMGKRMEVELREHFAKLGRKPNKMGWPKREFWNRSVRRNTHLTNFTSTTATVTIDSAEFIHRIQGGTIRPKRGKTLAIPANAAAYRAGSPGNADGVQLDYLPLHQGNLVGALIRRFETIVKKLKTKTKTKYIGGDVWYWLVRSVTHKPHPEELPDQAKLNADVMDTARATLRRLLHLQ